MSTETSYSLELSETACIWSQADAVDIAIYAAQRILAQMLLDKHPVGVLIQPGNQLAEDVLEPYNV